MKTIIALTLSVAAFLAGCGDNHPQSVPAPVQQQAQQGTVQPQQAPVIVQQDSGIMPALIGGAVGYMAGSMMNKPQQQPQIVEREVIREVPRSSRVAPVIGSGVKPTPVPTPNFAPPVVPKPAPAVVPNYKPSTPSYSVKPNYSQQGYSSVRQSAPTYRSSPSSSSRSSGRR